jgi:glycosyltransferase involved in cell wall biosynthesis
MTSLRRVTVDLTPLLPGGENGGAKLVARSLVQHMAALSPETEFTLVTSLANHADCADLDAANLHRACVEVESPRGALSVLRVATRLAINTLVPPKMRTRLKDRVWLALKRKRRAAVTRSAAAVADVMFCPFTAPYFVDPRVPLVSLVHDIQYLDMPRFFEAALGLNRHQNFLDACRLASRLICVSDFVRETVLRYGNVPPDRTLTIHSTVLHAVEAPRKVARPLGLKTNRYLLYPANVWPHKNHARLLEAFVAFLRSNPNSDLTLVCTGAPGAAADDLVANAQRQLPPGRFAFLGFLDEPDFAALLHACRALVFPSLYEGFGLPILEAMALSKPVLCSNVTSLPEVAGDAALLFDPYDVAQITAAIERLEREPALESSLIARGRQRVAFFGTPEQWAAKYLAAFEDVVKCRASMAAAVPSP